MPSGPISAAADGMLSLLALKNLGELPRQLGDQVVPVLEMEGWYLRARAINSLFDARVEVAPLINLVPWFIGGAVAQVPDDEWWYCHSMTVAVIAPAVPTIFDVIEFAGGFGGPAFTTMGRAATIYGSQLTAPLVASMTLRHGTLQNVWIPPGASLVVGAAAVNVQDAGGVTFTLEGNIRYTRVRI